MGTWPNFCSWAPTIELVLINSYKSGSVGINFKVVNHMNVLGQEFKGFELPHYLTRGRVAFFSGACAGVCRAFFVFCASATAWRRFVRLFSSDGYILSGFCSELWHFVGFASCPSKRSSYFNCPLVDCTFIEGL
ncbi:hypothetical protein TIFTF001_007066 [Ficus carica]|uniref:Uncharacterized protein n=1 Tax=Ficus carica TaxID=3494 RepID=A0AA88D0G2_FICCA|nr:hypothetical protein TIFTF001_007066 [Ficus carica]